MGLDRDLYPVLEVELRSPVAVAAAGSGRAWVVSAVDGRPQGRHRLLLVDTAGVAEVDVPLPPLVALEVTPRGEALVLAGAGGMISLCRVGCDGVTKTLLELPQAVSLAIQGERALVGDRGGQWVEVGVTAGDARTLTVLPGGEWALAPATRGGWWALEGGGVLSLLSPMGRSIGSVDLALERGRVVPQGRGGGCWVVGGERGVAVRVDARGRVRRRVERLPIAGFEAALPWGAGGVLCVTPGALVLLDHGGRLRLLQGGFAFAVDGAWM